MLIKACPGLACLEPLGPIRSRAPGARARPKVRRRRQVQEMCAESRSLEGGQTGHPNLPSEKKLRSYQEFCKDWVVLVFLLTVLPLQINVDSPPNKNPAKEESSKTSAFCWIMSIWGAPVSGVGNLWRSCELRTVDSEKLARAVDKAWKANAGETPLAVMIQVNSSGEETKHLGFQRYLPAR